MRKALAIDLDGTLLSTNTFRDYLSYCGHASLYGFRFDIALSILWWVILRKVCIISHSQMKRALLRRTSVFMNRKGRLDQFVERELVYLNPEAQHLMESYRNRGYLLILCTAAPGFYAQQIADYCHIDLCCATPLPSEIVLGQWNECVGQHKVDALSRMLRVHKAELEVVITDHHDDIPLLNYNLNGRNVVINPSAKTLRMLQQECKSPWEQA